MSDKEKVQQALAELWDVVKCRCNEAYTGRGLHDPDCECDSAEAVKVVASRIKALEAKLAKAVEALEAFAEFDALPTAVKRPDLFEIKVRKPILRTLAEIKGESHE